MKIDLKVSPAAQKRLENRLNKLPGKVYAKVVGAAASFAMTPVVKFARSRAQKRSGLYAKSIGKKRKNYKKDGVVFVVVGARQGFKDPVTGEDPTKISHLLEYGTANSPAYPHMRPALAANKSKVLERYRSKLLKGVDKQVVKLGGKL